MKNGFSLRQQELQVIMHYVLWAFEQMNPEKTSNTVIFL